MLYDPWWNPAIEARAITRTHCIGQTSTGAHPTFKTERPVPWSLAGTAGPWAFTPAHPFRRLGMMKFSELVRLLQDNGFRLIKEKGSIRY